MNAGGGTAGANEGDAAGAGGCIVRCVMGCGDGGVGLGGARRSRCHLLLLRLLSRRGRLVHLALLMQRVEALAQLDGVGACRIEIMRALRDLLLQNGNLTPHCILRRLLFRAGGGGGPTGRGRPRRSGCGDLLLLRLAELVQRVEVLSQLAGFGVRRIEIMRALRTLLL